MKKPLHPAILLMGAIMTISCFFACKKNNQPLSPSAQIIGKWTFQDAIGHYTMNGQTEKDTTVYGAPAYFEFRADSTIVIESEGNTYNGKWQIVNNKLFVTGTDYLDYTPGWEIPILTKTDLQLYRAESTQYTALVQMLDLNR